MNLPKMTESEKTAIRSLEKALALLRSVKTLEGTDKDGVERLLAISPVPRAFQLAPDSWSAVTDVKSMPTRWAHGALRNRCGGHDAVMTWIGNLCIMMYLTQQLGA